MNYERSCFLFTECAALESKLGFWWSLSREHVEVFPIASSIKKTKLSLQRFDLFDLEETR